MHSASPYIFMAVSLRTPFFWDVTTRHFEGNLVPKRSPRKFTLAKKKIFVFKHYLLCNTITVLCGGYVCPSLIQN
jgi:hypothetical protein